MPKKSGPWVVVGAARNANFIPKESGITFFLKHQYVRPPPSPNIWRRSPEDGNFKCEVLVFAL